MTERSAKMALRTVRWTGAWCLAAVWMAATIAAGAATESSNGSDSTEVTCRSYWTYIGARTDCSNASFTEVPNELANDVHILDVTHNNLTVLSNSSLALPQLSGLEILYLDYNRIQTVHREAFRHLSLLRALHLRGNRISHLHRLTFRHNPRIQELFLSGNPLVLPASGSFLSAPMLLVLHMDGCGLSTLPRATLADTPLLRALVLAHNRLRTLDEQPFAPLRSLMFLNLSANALSTVPRDALAPLHMLIRLDLQDNRLATLDAEAFEPLQGLRRLELGGNPLKCDCALKPFRLWAQLRSLAPHTQCTRAPTESTPATDTVPADRQWDQLLTIQC